MEGTTQGCVQQCILLRQLVVLGYSVKSVGTFIMFITDYMIQAFLLNLLGMQLRMWKTNEESLY